MKNKEIKLIEIRISIDAIDKFSETNILTKLQIESRDNLLKEYKLIKSK
jgi:hypothetical protein